MLSGDCSAHAEQNADGGQDPEFGGLDWPTGAECVRHADVEPDDDELRQWKEDDWKEYQAPAAGELRADVDVFAAPNHGCHHEDDPKDPDNDRHIQQMRVDTHCRIQHGVDTLVERKASVSAHQGLDGRD